MVTITNYVSHSTWASKRDVGATIILVTPTHKLKACKVTCCPLPLFIYRIECASTSYWPAAMLISTCLCTWYFSTCLSHFSDCDFLHFLGDVCIG